MKPAIHGGYFHDSEAHLHRPLAEADSRYGHRSALGTEGAGHAAELLLGLTGKWLTYHEPVQAAHAWADDPRFRAPARPPVVRPSGLPFVARLPGHGWGKVARSCGQTGFHIVWAVVRRGSLGRAAMVRGLMTDKERAFFAPFLIEVASVNEV